METLTFLKKAFTDGDTHQECLVRLQEQYGIKNSTNEKYPSLVVLNYDQINSPKTKTVVKECRSLVLEMNAYGFSVVSRSFDRFFNYGECDVTPDVSTLTACEKVDGSLISLFYYNTRWLYRTRSMIMPEGCINNWNTTWKEVIEEALDLANINMSFLNKDCTFIFEVTSVENRVVTKYEGRKATLLSVRDNVSGGYLKGDKYVSQFHKWNAPKVWEFNSIEDCMQTAKDLPNLEEGYVMYNKNGVPVCKVKNPA